MSLPDFDDIHLAHLINSIREVSPIFDFGQEAQKQRLPYMNTEHPARGLRSGTLAVSDRGAHGLPTPGSFEGLENREEVIAKPLTNNAGTVGGGSQPADESMEHGRDQLAGVPSEPSISAVQSSPPPNKDAEIARRMEIT